MTPEFTPISLEHLAKYRELLHLCESKASDNSFGNIWGWAENYGLEWRYDGTLCWLRQTVPQVTYWAPVGPWRSCDWSKCPDFKTGMEFTRVPEALSDLWAEALPRRVQVTETRGQWDYLYSVDELAALSGNRFHKKKNLVNQFKKTYNFSYYELTSDCVESVLDMQAEWSKWHEIEDSPSLLAENNAIARVLALWDSIPGLVGGVLRVDGEVAAYTVGEAVCPDTMVVHFEKGMNGFKGIYQAINRHFAEAVAETGKFKYLNREQDMDDEGLRKAKESYNPVEYVKKNRVRILPE